MKHELHYVVKAKVMTSDDSMSRETFETAAAQALMEAEQHLNSQRGNMARLRWHLDVSLAPAQPVSAFVTNPEMPPLPESFRKRRG